MLSASIGVFEKLGATVEKDCPDLSGADEVFGTLRAWLFDASFGELVRKNPDKVKETIRWNAEAGAKLTGADVGRAEILHTKLFEQVVAFFERYDVLLAPTTQVLPFPVEVEYPTEVARRRARQLPRVDALLHADLGHRLPGAVGAGRVHARRAAGGAADHRRAAGRPPRARGGPRVRAGHPLRRAPPASLTRSTAL